MPGDLGGGTAFGVPDKPGVGIGRGSAWGNCRPASSKKGRTGECAPPSRRLLEIHGPGGAGGPLPEAAR